MKLSFNVRSSFHYDNDIFVVTGIQSKFEKSLNLEIQFIVSCKVMRLLDCHMYLMCGKAFVYLWNSEKCDCNYNISI